MDDLIYNFECQNQKFNSNLSEINFGIKYNLKCKAYNSAQHGRDVMVQAARTSILKLQKKSNNSAKKPKREI